MAVLWTPVQAGEENAPVDLSTAIRRVAEQNMPAVVHIEVTRRQEVTNPFLPFENDPSFRYFFNVPRMPRKFKMGLKGLGTGMLMDGQGHIITSNYAAGGANRLEVWLGDGRRYSARLVGADPKTDLAVIQISTNEPLPHVTFGDSDRVGVGDWVVAIGCPRGLAQIVTQGIISAKHRQGVTTPHSYQDFLQTDVVTHPENSGGPLLNLQGEVIGVNAAIVSQSGGFKGIGFAIPSNMAIHIARQLLAHGRVERGWLGVRVQDLTPELAKSFGLKRPVGALIAHVVKGGPADRGGIKNGDVVTGYRGKRISDGGILQNEVAISPIGEEVKVTLFRNGKEQTLRVRVGDPQEMITGQTSSIEGRLGVTVRPVTSQEGERYGLDSQQGLVITSMHPDSPLAKIGFEVNDMVLEINGRSIDGLEDFRDLINALSPQERVVLLGLDHRSGRSGYVQVVVP